MGIRHRQMRPSDVRQCADIVAAHPILGPHYGNAIADLRPAWLQLLGREAFKAVVFEEISGLHVRILGAGITAFVSDDFMREVKTSPLFWIGPELLKRVERGNCPLLTDKELQDANSNAGLNLILWQLGMLPEDVKRADVGNEAMTAFDRQHRGFLLKELIGQPESLEHVYGLHKNGLGLLNSALGSYSDFDLNRAHDFLTQPCIMGGTRETILTKFGSWISRFFVYQPPKCGFSFSEQRMLLSALDGGTDEELAEGLQISVSAVKRKWRSIYNRSRTCLPELLPPSACDEWACERGREKKRRLITYLRDHPEEVRPVSRRLLKRAARVDERNKAKTQVHHATG